ncbi:MAG: PepSY domain-containing protein [Desulfovibrionaceae bacterium]
MSRITTTLVLLAALAASATLANAAAPGGNDAAPVLKAGVTLSQAVLAAERQAGGKASRAEFERGDAGPVYEVEVVSGAKVFDVRVDADKGTVLSSREDKIDHDRDGGHDEERDDDHGRDHEEEDN